MPMSQQVKETESTGSLRELLVCISKAILGYSLMKLCRLINIYQQADIMQQFPV